MAGKKKKINWAKWISLGGLGVVTVVQPEFFELTIPAMIAIMLGTKGKK